MTENSEIVAGNSEGKIEEKKAPPASIAPYCWPKGVSGNVRGRPRAFGDAYTKLAKKRARKVAENLYEIAESPKNPAAAVAAAKELADRVDGAVPRGESSNSNKGVQIVLNSLPMAPG